MRNPWDQGTPHRQNHSKPSYFVRHSRWGPQTRAIRTGEMSGSEEFTFLYKNFSRFSTTGSARVADPSSNRMLKFFDWS